jgi:hypothetical protein
MLLPQNRKVRHLRGIYLRNLSFVRPQGRTIDDAGVGLAKNHQGNDAPPPLHHSASSESLRPRPLRRRSTNLANTNPVARQKMLEAALDAHVADVFFSLHVEEEPVYISETGTRATVCYEHHLGRVPGRNGSITLSLD